MKKIAITLICLFTVTLAQAQYDNWAVGFKLGEPTGVNIRKYFNNINALDISFGTYGGIIGNNRKYRGEERGYRNVGLAVQVHYLWHTPLFNKENLHVYYGIGGQINSRKYYPSRLNGQHEKQISLGGSVLAGFEYFLPDGRLSVFVEGGGYSEVIPRIFFLSPNVSGGVRLNL